MVPLFGSLRHSTNSDKLSDPSLPTNPRNLAVPIKLNQCLIRHCAQKRRDQNSPTTSFHYNPLFSCNLYESLCAASVGICALPIFRHGRWYQADFYATVLGASLRASIRRQRTVKGMPTGHQALGRNIALLKESDQRHRTDCREFPVAGKTLTRGSRNWHVIRMAIHAEQIVWDRVQDGHHLLQDVATFRAESDGPGPEERFTPDAQRQAIRGGLSVTTFCAIAVASPWLTRCCSACIPVVRLASWSACACNCCCAASAAAVARCNASRWETSVCSCCCTSVRQVGELDL